MRNLQYGAEGADQPQHGNNDDNNMPMLVSDDEDPNPGQGAIRK